MDICGHEKYRITFSQSDTGNIQRMDNKINAIPEISEEYKQQHDNLVKQLDDSKKELAIPFPKEQELAEKLARLEFLDAELAKENDDTFLGENNDKSFEIATEQEKREAEEREKIRREKEINGNIDLNDY